MELKTSKEQLPSSTTSWSKASPPSCSSDAHRSSTPSEKSSATRKIWPYGESLHAYSTLHLRPLLSNPLFFLFSFSISLFSDYSLPLLPSLSYSCILLSSPESLSPFLILLFILPLIHSSYSLFPFLLPRQNEYDL